MPLPQTINLSGRGDMGSLTDRLKPPRFYLTSVYSLSALRVTFVSGSGSATLQLRVDHRFGPSFDRVVFEWPTIGSGGKNVEYRVEATERDTYLFYPDPDLMTRDELVLIWTDPDAGKLTTWAVSAELMPQS